MRKLYFGLWLFARVLCTTLAFIASTLFCYNASYNLRGVYSFGGEYVLVPICTCVIWQFCKLLNDAHKKSIVAISLAKNKKEE